MARVTLEQHNGLTLEDPTWPDVERSLRQLHPRTRGYFILSRDGASYVQAAGAKLRAVCEWRDLSAGDGTFHHYVLGRPGRGVELTSIPTAVGQIRLQANEVLTLEDVVSVFRSFLDAGIIPDGYVLRDDTDRFNRAG